VTINSTVSQFKAGHQQAEWQMLLTPTLPPEEGKWRKRERDLKIEYKKFY